MNNNDNNNSKDPQIKSDIGWRPALYVPWLKKSSSKRRQQQPPGAELKMGRLLGGEVPTPEDVSLMTTGAVKRRRKTFEIFHWKFMLLSVLFVVGLCGTTVMWFTTIYNEQIFKTLTLGNGTKLHVAWKNPPLEPLLCVHIFNYTNVDEYFSEDNKNNKAVKLKVQDVGPYCFRERIERTNIKFVKNGTEMSYREKRDHTFDFEASNGSLNDTVFVPNVLILSVYKEVKDLSKFTRTIGYAGLSTAGAKAFIQVPVNEYLLGYEDEIFSLIGSIHEMVSSDQKKIPKKFGVLQKRVGMSNDTVLIKTGDGNLDDMGQVTEINNITQFTAWKSDQCNRVDGSDGLFFRRSLIQSYGDVSLFHKDSCRTLPLEYNTTVQLRGGILAHRYQLKRDMFDTEKVENQCFYNATDSPRSGVLEISSCSAVSGAPMAISRPHFMMSNANLDKNGEEIIEGFQPDQSKHDFHIDIFPPIGLTVRTLMRLQLNIVVKNPHNNQNLNPLEDKTILPMVWIEMNSGNDVPEKMFSLLYHLSYTMKWAELALKWTFLLFTFGVAFVLFKISFLKSSKKELMIISKKSKIGNNVVSSVYVPN